MGLRVWQGALTGVWHVAHDLPSPSLDSGEPVGVAPLDRFGGLILLAAICSPLPRREGRGREALLHCWWPYISLGDTGVLQDRR